MFYHWLLQSQGCCLAHAHVTASSNCSCQVLSHSGRGTLLDKGSQTCLTDDPGWSHRLLPGGFWFRLPGVRSGNPYLSESSVLSGSYELARWQVGLRDITILLINLLYFMRMDILLACIYMCMHAWYHMDTLEPGLQTTVGCRVDVGYWTGVFSRSEQCSYALNHFSSPT